MKASLDKLQAIRNTTIAEFKSAPEKGELQTASGKRAVQNMVRYKSPFGLLKRLMIFLGRYKESYKASIEAYTDQAAKGLSERFAETTGDDKASLKSAIKTSPEFQALAGKGASIISDQLEDKMQGGFRKLANQGVKAVQQGMKAGDNGLKIKGKIILLEAKKAFGEAVKSGKLPEKSKLKWGQTIDLSLLTVMKSLGEEVRLTEMNSETAKTFELGKLYMALAELLKKGNEADIADKRDEIKTKETGGVWSGRDIQAPPSHKVQKLSLMEVQRELQKKRDALLKAYNETSE